MSVVYVREQGAVIRKSGETLRVTEGNKETLTVPLANLEQLVLMGNVQLTTQAAVMLLRNDVDVVFMSHYGKYRGRLLAMESKFAELRHLQLRLCDDETRSLNIARQIIGGKIGNQRVILQRRVAEDNRAGRALNGMLEMLKLALEAPTLDGLRGYEGKAAAYYFDGVKSFFAPEWNFKAREYYPPPDPANALLSFVYTLLLKDVEAQIQLVGLDPYLGFFHTLGYSRPALALDVMEEFRPTIADMVVLNLVRGEQVTLADFERTNDPERPVRMSRASVDKVVAAYEQRLEDRVFHPLANGQTHYRRAIELQVRLMARVVRQEAASYEPLVMR